MLGFMLLPVFIVIYLITMASESSSNHTYEKNKRTCSKCGRYNKYPETSYGITVTYSCRHCGEELWSEYD